MQSRVTYVVIGLAIVIGLLFIFKPKMQDAPLSPTQPVAKEKESVSTVTPKSNKKTFDLVVTNKKLSSGESILKANQGDEVTITIISDEPEELHLHAYDKSVALTPNKKETLTFIADISGRFPFELEHSGIELGSLEVQPK